MNAGASQLTAEQQAIRSTGVGASEVWDVVRGRGYAVWCRKRGLVPPWKGNETTEWGNRLEEPIARAYADRTGYHLTPGYTVRSPHHRIAIATPDRFVSTDPLAWEPSHLLQIKNRAAHRRREYGPEGSGEVLPADACQGQWELLASGLDRVDFAVLFGGNDLAIFTLHRDEDLQRDLLARVESWWDRYVVTGVEPPPDASDAAAEALKARFPKHRSPLKAASDEAEELAMELLAARRAADAAEERLAQVEGRMKVLIGDAEGIEGRGWRVTWRAAKDSTVTDWVAVAKEAGATDALVAKHTTSKAGSRRFLPSFPEEE